LKPREFHADQAEAHVQIMAEIVEDELATKQDVRDLKNELRQLEYRLIIKMGVLVGTIVTLAIAVTAAIAKLI
jgi:hypothetical protein